MDIIKILNTRYTTKIFDPTKRLSSEQYEQLKQVLQYSISSLNGQPWHFFIASGAKKDELAACAMDFNQQRIKDASQLVIFCGKEHTEAHCQSVIDRTRKVRGDDAVNDFYINWLKSPVGEPANSDATRGWVNQQVYLAFGMFITGMATMGIDVCPMEGFFRDKVDQALGLKEKGMRSLLIAPIGFHGADDFNLPSKAPKVRLEMNQIITELK